MAAPGPGQRNSLEMGIAAVEAVAVASHLSGRGSFDDSSTGGRTPVRAVRFLAVHISF